MSQPVQTSSDGAAVPIINEAVANTQSNQNGQAIAATTAGPTQGGNPGSARAEAKQAKKASKKGGDTLEGNMAALEVGQDSQRIMRNIGARSTEEYQHTVYFV